MIEENSDDISGTGEGVEGTSDSVSEGIDERVSDSLEPFPMDAVDTSPEDDEDPVSIVDRRREKRRRQRMIESLADTYGMADEEALATMMLIDDLLPEADRMSTAKHVGQRLEHAMKGLKTHHPRLLFNRDGKGLDMTDPSRYFYPTGAFAKLLDDEEGILRAIVVNRRARAGAERMAREHDAVEELLLTEYVRRSTLVEQWRYLLPKYMLPIFSMMEAAGVKAKEARLDTALFNRIRDVILEWSGGMVSREDLMSAARRTEEEFLHVLKEDADGSGARERSDDTFEACRERLGLALLEAREDLAGLDDIDADDMDMSEARVRVDRLMTAVSIEAGMDRSGRLVFPSVDTFMDAIAARRRGRRGDGGTGAGPVAAPVSKPPGEDESMPVVDADADGTGEAPVPVEAVEGVSAETEDRDPAGDVVDEDEGLVETGPGEFGPAIPDDLFGPEVSGTDDDDEGDGGLGDPSDEDVHPFAEEALDTDDAFHEVGDVDDDGLAPVGVGPLAYDPDDLTNWPTDNMQVRRIASGLARSTGLSRSTFARPFSMWRPSMDSPPFCFMGFRLQPDLSAREGREGPIEPVDLSRLEIGDGQWKAATLPGPSRILGQSHPLMLPPHSRLGWYGRTLGWSETDIRALGAFGSPAKPETVTPKGDGVKLADAMRGVAGLRMAELAQKVPGHFLGDTKVGPERRAEATEDLARYWIFVLLARHDQAGFDLMFGDGFFQGVHGPDFVVDAMGVADFGSADRGGHIGVFSPELVRKLPAVNPAEPFVGTKGEGVVSGVRRLGV